MKLPTKPQDVDKIITQVQRTAQKTRELLAKSQALHGAVEAVHDQTDKLHRHILQEREKARKRRNRRHLAGR